MLASEIVHLKLTMRCMHIRLSLQLSDVKVGKAAYMAACSFFPAGARRARP